MKSSFWLLLFLIFYVGISYAAAEKMSIPAEEAYTDLIAGWQGSQLKFIQRQFNEDQKIQENLVSHCLKLNDCTTIEIIDSSLLHYNVIQLKPEGQNFTGEVAPDFKEEYLLLINSSTAVNALRNYAFIRIAQPLGILSFYDNLNYFELHKTLKAAPLNPYVNTHIRLLSSYPRFIPANEKIPLQLRVSAADTSSQHFMSKAEISDIRIAFINPKYPGNVYPANIENLEFEEHFQNRKLILIKSIIKLWLN